MGNNRSVITDTFKPVNTDAACTVKKVGEVPEVFRRLLGISFLRSKVYAADIVEEKDNDEDLEDPVERMLKKTGCLEAHYSVQECIAETKDWRQCQEQVKEFKRCMKKHKRDARRIRI